MNNTNFYICFKVDLPFLQLSIKESYRALLYIFGYILNIEILLLCLSDSFIVFYRKRKINFVDKMLGLKRCLCAYTFLIHFGCVDCIHYTFSLTCFLFNHVTKYIWICVLQTPTDWILTGPHHIRYKNYPSNIVIRWISSLLFITTFRVFKS